MARKVQKVSIFSIAKEAGVSVPTVSRVLNRKAGISEATRKKVNALLERRRFRPAYPAMRSVKIAVCYPWPDLSDYVRKAMKGVYACAQRHGLVIHLLITGAPRKESLLQAIRDQQCSGVIALLPEQYRDDLAALEKTELMTIAIDTELDSPGLGSIDHDSYSGSCQAASHLLELGHRRIAYLTYAAPVHNQRRRFEGAEETLRERGVKLPDERVVRWPVEQSSRARGRNGFLAMRELLSRETGATAVLAVDDAMALGAMAAAHEAGLRIPEDLSVIGFDNYEETEYWAPPLTTVDHPIEQAGFRALEAIHAGRAKPGSWVPPREVLPTSLIVRRSTGPVT